VFIVHCSQGKFEASLNGSYHHNKRYMTPFAKCDAEALMDVLGFAEDPNARKQHQAYTNNVPRELSELKLLGADYQSSATVRMNEKLAECPDSPTLLSTLDDLFKRSSFGVINETNAPFLDLGLV
jgi:hypothetical protein